MSKFNSSQMLSKFEQHLSLDRFRTYTNKTAGDKEAAFYLYIWNIAISGAFYGPLQTFEVVLRNSLHGVLSNCYGLSWYDSKKLGLSKNGCVIIEQAKERVEKNKYKINPPNIVANLSFGFWTSILSKKGTNGDHKELWNHVLSNAFPNLAFVDRFEVQQTIWQLNKLRGYCIKRLKKWLLSEQADYRKLISGKNWRQKLKELYGE